MDGIEIIGLAAAALTTAANIPQTYKIIKTKSTEDISTITYVLLLIGLLLWVTYGVMKNDFPIIIANGISATISAIILVLKHMPKKALSDLHDKVTTEGENQNT